MVRRHAELPRAILVAGDVVAATAACLTAYWVRFHVQPTAVIGSTDGLAEHYLRALPVAATLMVVACSLGGSYGRDHLGRGASMAQSLRVTVLAGLVLSAAALLYWKEFQFSRQAVALAAGLFGPFFFLGRRVCATVVRRLRAGHRFSTPCVVIGGGAPAQALAAAFAGNPWTGLEVVAVLPFGDVPACWAACRSLRDRSELRTLLEAKAAREVYVALSAQHAAATTQFLQELEDLAVNVHLVPDLGAGLLMNAGATVLSGVPLVSLRERPLYGLRAALKRVVDLVLVAVIAATSWPLLLLIAVLVKVTSRGPVLFRQERMGLDGKPFSMLKFRTMQPDAERGSGPVFTSPDDPRTTHVGAILRRFSLDELPQLWNVLRGDMSLVGPRPERAPFIAEFRRRLPGYMLRHSVKAGMTGWAQVHGLRGRSSLEDRLRYDLEYIDRWSLGLDFEILGRTAVQVVVGENAY